MQYPASRMTGGSIQKKNIAADRGESSVISKIKSMNPMIIPATMSQHDSGTINAWVGNRVMPAIDNIVSVNSNGLLYSKAFSYRVWLYLQ